MGPPLKEGGSRESREVVLEGLRNAGHLTQIEAVTMFRHPPVHGAPLSTAYGLRSHMPGTQVRIRPQLSASENEVLETKAGKNMEGFDKQSTCRVRNKASDLPSQEPGPGHPHRLDFCNLAQAFQALLGL